MRYFPWHGTWAAGVLFAAVRAADARVVPTDKQLESATETYLDAETDLERARLAWVNARIDARVARAHLAHAAGRDQSAARR